MAVSNNAAIKRGGAQRARMIRQFAERNPRRGTRITEDDPRWNPKTMGNKRGSIRITEDDPRWNAATMGNKTGYSKGRWYSKGKKLPFDMRGQ